MIHICEAHNCWNLGKYDKDYQAHLCDTHCDVVSYGPVRTTIMERARRMPWLITGMISGVMVGSALVILIMERL